MATLITDKAQLASAATADLVFTYNHLTGKSIKKFSSRDAGLKQIAKAWPSAPTQPETSKETEVKKANGKTSNARRGTAKRAPHGFVKNAVVVATGSGKTKLQAKSERNKCFEFVHRSAQGISVEKLSEKMGKDARGYVQKLIEGEHIRIK